MLSALAVTGLVAPSLSLKSSHQGSKHAAVYLGCLALPQMLLAVLALTTFHVQIVNRIATGYPVWYIVLANAMVSQTKPSETAKTIESDDSAPYLKQLKGRLDKPATQQLIFRGMFMYSIIQGGLYASFMPPA